MKTGRFFIFILVVALAIGQAVLLSPTPSIAQGPDETPTPPPTPFLPTALSGVRERDLAAIQQLREQEALLEFPPPPYYSHGVIPPTIRVAITGYSECMPWLNAGSPIIRVDVIDFKTYVKNVLPNEWAASWNMNSLKAGAIAAKGYAWHRINARGGWSYDVRDNTCDQVYRPNTAHPNTNAAVDATWNEILRLNRTIIEVNYLSHDLYCQQHPDWPRCMGQVDSNNWANQGYDYKWILHHYYDPISIDSLPGMPTIQFPTAGAIVGKTFNIVLQAGTANATGKMDWHVQVDNDADFSSPVFDNGSSGWSTSTTIPITVPSNGTYWVRARQGDGVDLASFMTAPVQFIAGNFPDTIGVFRNANHVYYLRTANSAGNPTFSTNFGLSNDLPIVGDWNGDGISSPGVFRAGRFYLSNKVSGAITVDYNFLFGAAGDIPVAGDWNGDGKDEIGVYRPSLSRFYFRNSLTAGSPDNTINFGLVGDRPLVGDWNGDKKDTVGVWRPNNQTFYLSNAGCFNCSAALNLSFRYGVLNDLPFVGDWDGNGTSGVGVFRPSTGMMYLRNPLSAGTPNLSFRYGVSTDKPLAGYWGTDPCAAVETMPALSVGATASWGASCRPRQAQITIPSDWTGHAWVDMTGATSANYVMRLRELNGNLVKEIRPASTGRGVFFKDNMPKGGKYIFEVVPLNGATLPALSVTQWQNWPVIWRGSPIESSSDMTEWASWFYDERVDFVFTRLSGNVQYKITVKTKTGGFIGEAYSDANGRAVYTIALGPQPETPTRVTVTVLSGFGTIRAQNVANPADEAPIFVPKQ